MSTTEDTCGQQKHRTHWLFCHGYRAVPV